MAEEEQQNGVFAVLSRYRKRAVARFGTTIVHAVEDGAVFGFTLGLLPTFQVGAMIILAAVGVEARNPKRLIKLIDEIGREEDIKQQPLYFVVALALSAVAGAVFGTFLNSIYSDSVIVQALVESLSGAI
jgi:TctA family transporter